MNPKIAQMLTFAGLTALVVFGCLVGFDILSSSATYSQAKGKILTKIAPEGAATNA